jgi:hypothetical protein
MSPPSSSGWSLAHENGLDGHFILSSAAKQRTRKESNHAPNHVSVFLPTRVVFFIPFLFFRHTQPLLFCLDPLLRSNLVILAYCSSPVYLAGRSGFSKSEQNRFLQLSGGSPGLLSERAGKKKVVARPAGQNENQNQRQPSAARRRARSFESFCNQSAATLLHTY